MKSLRRIKNLMGANQAEHVVGLNKKGRVRYLGPKQKAPASFRHGDSRTCSGST